MANTPKKLERNPEGGGGDGPDVELSLPADVEQPRPKRNCHGETGKDQRRRV